MQNKEQKGDPSVNAIAGAHVVLGMDLPKQKCPRLMGFALRRADPTEGKKYWLPRFKTFRKDLNFNVNPKTNLTI